MNLVVQLLVVLILSFKFALKSVDPEAAHKWWLEEGHAFKHELGGESLVSRICRLDPTVSTAAWHFGSYQTIEEYMGQCQLLTTTGQ